MPAPLSIPVTLGPRSYSILVGEGLVPIAAAKLPLLSSPDARVLVIADSRLKVLARSLMASLGKRCVGSCFLSGGESTKSMSTLPSIYAVAARARLDRRSLVVAIGGGVIGDVAGFFAATYLRGIRIIHVPTTLVAQVDSSIGGKTGVNLPAGKNLVGAIHQPALVLVDPKVLRTLPPREYRSGLAEVIKTGVIADLALFRRLEFRMDQILQRDATELAWVIARCCKIKARVVSRDERETLGLRAILNFGHTIGHGIEAAAHFRLLHGEAIALGMLAATRLSRKLTGLGAAAADRIEALIARAGLPMQLDRAYTNRAILAAMQLDKKAVSGQMRFVLAKRIGSVCVNVPVSRQSVEEVLASLR